LQNIEKVEEAPTGMTSSSIDKDLKTVFDKLIGEWTDLWRHESLYVTKVLPCSLTSGSLIEEYWY
jgi:hypothetical protein